MSRALREVVLDVLGLAEELEQPRLMADLRLLAQRIHRPDAFVCVVGETSTGKSTLVNGLLGAPVLPAAAGPSTGTVTQVLCRPVRSDRMLAVNRDGMQTELDEATFRAYSEKPPEGLLRVQLHTDRAGPERRGVNIIDTPGYNAVVAEHEEVLRAFLPESDAIVFVAGYRTGFGQADQDLYEVARDATSDDAEMPMFLALNRSPPTVDREDRRVQEIVSNARDSLRRDVDVILVRSAPIPQQGAPATLPEVTELWDAVFHAAQADERRRAVGAKLAAALAELTEDLRSSVATRLAAAEATVEEVAIQVDILRDGRARSLDAVKRCVARLTVSLPGRVAFEANRMKAEVQRVVDDAEKWLGQPDCTAYVVEHALPFEGRKACDAVGEAVAVELEALDRELEEIANTTVRRLHQRVRPANDVASRMATDLARTLSKRASGAVAANLLRAFGGVGGVAAGAGNLVKTLLRRVGDLVKTRFSRETYAAIGRFFNKKMVTRLGAAASVAIDGAFFVWDAHHWRGQLKEQVASAITGWQESVRTSLLTEHVPQIEQVNVEGVYACYDDMIADAEAGGAGLDEVTRARLYAAARSIDGYLDEIRYFARGDFPR